jgi:hypothetical protein
MTLTPPPIRTASEERLTERKRTHNYAATWENDA